MISRISPLFPSPSWRVWGLWINDTLPFLFPMFHFRHTTFLLSNVSLSTDNLSTIQCFIMDKTCSTIPLFLSLPIQISKMSSTSESGPDSLSTLKMLFIVCRLARLSRRNRSLARAHFSHGGLVHRTNWVLCKHSSLPVAGGWQDSVVVVVFGKVFGYGYGWDGFVLWFFWLVSCPCSPLSALALRDDDADVIEFS